MKKDNVFNMTKMYFDTAFQNFERFQNQNEKMMKLFLDEMEHGNKELYKNYNEWIDSTKKAFADYRELMTKGLDYLSESLEKGGQKQDNSKSE